MTTEALTPNRVLEVANATTGQGVSRETMARTQRDRRKKHVVRGILYVVLFLGGLGMVFPFVWMLTSSFKQAQDIYSLSLIPPSPTFDNYGTVLEDTSFPRWFANSLFVATVTTLSVAFFDSLAGYTLAKFRFPGVTIIFVLILSTLMVPTEMLIIPWFMLSIDFGWTDSYWGIMFPGVISAFGVFLMRQFFMGVPNDLIDAARIDGFSEFRIFWNIALPLVKPAVAALCIFTFLGNWNAYIWPLIAVRSDDMRTLPVGIAFFSSEAGSAFHLIMAAVAMATIPVIVVFLVFQKQIIKGIVLTGIKG